MSCIGIKTAIFTIELNQTGEFSYSHNGVFKGNKPFVVECNNLTNGDETMQRVDAFIDSLEEWLQLQAKKDKELQEVLAHLSDMLGEPSAVSVEDITQLKERILFLINEQKINEKFLVNALLREMTEYLEHPIKEHGESIILNELMADSYQEDYNEIPEQISKAGKGLRSLTYRYKLESRLEDWELIKLQNFSFKNRKMWESEDIQKSSKILKMGTLHVPDLT